MRVNQSGSGLGIFCDASSGTGNALEVDGNSTSTALTVFHAGSANAISAFGNVSFFNDLSVSGTISAFILVGTFKFFKIDHPLDSSKDLYHAAVESSELKTFYDGVVTLDSNGEATVQLPAWLDAVNGNIRYQLTAIGEPNPALYVAAQVSGNSFKIAGGKAGSKVSWQLTGIRRDAAAQANPLIVEQPKPPPKAPERPRGEP